MALESATYVSQLVSTNPNGTDGISQGDDHIRLVKSTLQATFPNIGAAAVTATAAQLNDSTALTGLVAAFVNTTTNPNWLRLNGGTFAYATYPALGAMLGYVSGTCTLPNMEDTGRFPRSITPGLLSLASQSNQFAAHTHTASVSVSGSATTGNESVVHIHGFSGTTSAQSNDHTHSVPGTTVGDGPGGNQIPVMAAAGAVDDAPFTSGGVSQDHSHTYNGVTGTDSVHHTHDISMTSTGALTTAASGAGTETRPEAMAFIFYVHV